jgi:hypothetical protein
MLILIMIIAIILFVIYFVVILNGQSGKKSRDLALILKKCKPMFNQMKAIQNGTFMPQMLMEEKYDPVDDLYALCLKYKPLSEVVKRHNATKADFNSLHTHLLVTCPMFSKEGNFVPVSAFAFPQTLEYILRNKNRTENISPVFLMNYFNI